ncbi:hypothetical protein GUJ93_ZPchr0004g39198 [Zizania palustris]|uniref:Uncharacterized protein n=1 Tax=Zizania palustris TaxID=103762 RepID=A0A8J5S0B0_ZIZPA|nr:hypothetical protein GUJ93_ZPchr0004g39198 [Zizania palustris]
MEVAGRDSDAAVGVEAFVVAARVEEVADGTTATTAHPDTHGQQSVAANLRKPSAPDVLNLPALSTDVADS